MRRSRWFLVSCLLAATLVGVPLLAGEAAAFQRLWIPFGFFNVLPAEGFLYDDVPAGVPGMMGAEAGLLAFQNNSAANEFIGYYTTTGLPVSPSYNYLEVKAAVSDTSWFRVGYGTTPTSCTYFPAALNTIGAAGSSPYLTKFYPLPTNHLVRRICIQLTDTPDATASGRSKALIDYVRLRTSAGATGWFEFFAGSP